MPVFQSPDAYDFFDNRIIVSWNIEQPPKLPPLKQLTFKIWGVPELEFDPPQIPHLEIPQLNGNKFVISWVIKRPAVKTKITLLVQNLDLEEEYSLVIEP